MMNNLLNLRNFQKKNKENKELLNKYIAELSYEIGKEYKSGQLNHLLYKSKYYVEIILGRSVKHWH